MQLEIFSTNQKKLVFEVEFLTILDMVINGEIGIHPNHEEVSGIGKYYVYDHEKTIVDFIYYTNGSIIKLFCY